MQADSLPAEPPGKPVTWRGETDRHADRRLQPEGSLALSVFSDTPQWLLRPMIEKNRAHPGGETGKHYIQFSRPQVDKMARCTPESGWVYIFFFFQAKLSLVFYLFKNFFVRVELIYNVLLFSSVQQS